MIAGVPGIGISGLFYLLSAFFMPFIELTVTLRGQSSLKRWKFVMTHFFYFWGIVLGSYAVIVILEVVMRKFFGIALFSNTLNSSESDISSFISVVPVIITLSLLVSVLAGVKILRLISSRTASS